MAIFRLVQALPRIIAPAIVGSLFIFGTTSPGRAQPLGTPDREAPGDEMIQRYLADQAKRIHRSFVRDRESLAARQRHLPRWKQEYLYMLGLWPLPEKTPLQAEVTGTIDRGDVVIEKLHFQSRPRLYVTGNLYRPKAVPDQAKLPAVLYVCGHSGRGRNGNKTAFQSHGLWFARHGFVCLIIDTLQLGEIAAIHHGTYREQRWWWHARGYTPAGVECWNGIRAIDYLASRSDVDPQRMGVTGISGGGAATFWIAAADDRVAIAAPVSGMADLPAYVENRVINGHCDCMFLYNTFQWPWTRIASLVAPRPMRFVNSDQDAIFPMDANERIINRLERIYSLFGESSEVDAVVSIGGHAYREDIRRAVFRFFRTQFYEDPREITDSEVDLVQRTASGWKHPIPPEQLRVFPADEDLPKDQLNTTIDEHFVPLGNPGEPAVGELKAWRESIKQQLAAVTFRSFGPWIAAATPVRRVGTDVLLETEEGIRIWLKQVDEFPIPMEARRVVLHLRTEPAGSLAWLHDRVAPGDVVLELEPRGTGATRWTRRNPPNYVERAHVLVGQTVDTGRIRDVVSAVRYLRQSFPDADQYLVAGAGRGAGWAAYAALWDEKIDGVWAENMARSHRDADAAQLLNVARVCGMRHVRQMLGDRLSE